MGLNTYTKGIKDFHRSWSGSLAKRRLCLGPAGVINCSSLSASSFWVSLFPGRCGYNSTLTASSFRIRNRSTGIPSPPLSLFIVMLPKAQLTLSSRMSGYRWVITPSWLKLNKNFEIHSQSLLSLYFTLMTNKKVKVHSHQVLKVFLLEDFNFQDAF